MKAKSDGSLSSSAATTENSSALMSRLKSKSLEPLTGQAFNGPEAEIVAVLSMTFMVRIRISDYWIQIPAGTLSSVLKIKFLAKILC